MTGSMEPKVRPGDALVVQPKAASELQPGQVVVVHDPAVRGRLLSHRLVARLSNSELITKGDANANADSTPVKPEAVLGLAQLRVPYIGLVWKWQQESWPATGIGAVALTLAAVLAAACDSDEPGTRGWKGLRALRRPSGSPTSA
jgi:signal peptidase